LTGRRLLEPDAPRDSAREQLARSRRGERLLLRAEEPAPSAALAAIIARATSPERTHRHSNAGELYEELIGLLYESGRRVGALELARWLEELGGGLAHESSQEVLGPFSGIEEIFSDLPTSARSVAPPARGAVLLVVDDLDARELAARAEWREVSILLIDGYDRAELPALGRRFGAEQLRLSDGPALVFGLAEGAGRDAHAAARCALRLMRTRPELRLRAVVHSGSLLLDAEGEAAHEASKEALGAEARRWLKRARKGELIATPSAAALLRERFELAGEHDSGARAVRRELDPGEGVAKFVGRREELRAIGEVFARANRGELCVLGIRGEGGMGKSRLVLEIERRLRHAGHDVGVYVASCSPQGQAIPFFALQELLRAVLGLEELDPPGRVHEQIERLRMLGLSGEQREALAQLVGVSTGGDVQPSKLETALVRVAYKLAQDRLTVFVWDGSEFMDSASAELVRKLLSVPFAGRLLVIFAYRRSSRMFWSELPGFSEVTLGALSEEEVARLARNRLGASEVHADFVRELTVKTGGNPLFVEELVSALREASAVNLEQGVARLVTRYPALALPRSLRGLVASRVGKLSGSERLILQLAVTFGQRFSAGLLACAAGLAEETVVSALSQLEEREIVRQVGASEYMFAHDLVREVLYAAISLDERPSLHGAVARALETLLPAERETAVERLAFHYREAGEWDAAVRFLIRAGERLESEHALEAAIEVYSQALELASRGGAPDRERMLALHVRIGKLAINTRASEAVADRMGAAIELAESCGSEEYVARFAMLRGQLLNKASRFREGRLWLERAHAIAGRLRDAALERDIALAAAEAHTRNGEYLAVVQYVDEALAVARGEKDVAAEVRGLLVILPAHAALGELDQAREALARLEELVSETSERHVQVELERARSVVFELAGEYARARDVAHRALDLAKEYDLSYEVALSAYQLGALCLRAHHDKRAFAALRLSYELSSEHGYARLQWRTVCMMGFLDAMRFDSEQGYARMQQALQYAEERAYVVDLVEDKYLLAMVEQKRGQAERASALLREVIELADAHGHVRACDQAEKALRAIEESRPIELSR
jgi:tetratricopeptide (TPR) repeat protein